MIERDSRHLIVAGFARADEGPGSEVDVSVVRKLGWRLGAGDAPNGLVARVGELDGLIAAVDERLVTLEQEPAGLDVESDAQALREALAEFDGLWASMTQSERARSLALLLEAVVYDAKAGEVELRFRAGAPIATEAAA